MFFNKNNTIVKKEFFKILGITFALAFITNAIVVYLWNLIFHGKGAFDWGLAVVVAITISIAVSLAWVMKGNKNN